MSGHPIPLVTTPMSAYEYASRSFCHEVRDLGASEATRRWAPRRIFGGWWSPLFDVVLRVPEPARQEARRA